MIRRRAALMALPAILCLVGSATAGPRPALERPFVVAIDAGHGGDNHGCRSPDGRTREKDVTLELARALKARLGERLPHAWVVLTRTGDESLTLSERVAIANDARADLFLSVHVNASPTRTHAGYETYVLEAKQSGQEAARAARRDNDTIGSAGSTRDAAAILTELTMAAHRQRAARFAHAIQRAQGARFPDRIDRGVKQAPFDVLIGAQMPAVLFEAAFLDHPTEGALLGDPSERARIVDGLAEAIVQQYREDGRL